jgi:ATP-dependent helicase/nuclease subunit B
LSASTVEALRACPYRFFAKAVLRLRESEELDDEAEKRDYGTWLHAVLLRFHERRPGPRSRDEDLAALQQAALEEGPVPGLDPASFLPFEASFARLARHYVDWLAGRDARQAAWLEGEREIVVAPPELGGTRLKGVIDRIDSLPGQVRELIDYKTGSSLQLKKKVDDPLEDTQLAFYALLERLREEGAAPGPVLARYLALDSSQGIVDKLEHKDVEASAEALLAGLAGELQRLRGGAPMPALGEGPVCNFCEVRGLCRRDEWPATGEGAR